MIRTGLDLIEGRRKRRERERESETNREATLSRCHFSSVESFIIRSLEKVVPLPVNKFVYVIRCGTRNIIDD